MRASHTLDLARERALAEQARDAAAHLRETESRSADTQTRIDALTRRSQVLRRELAHEAAALAPMLPLMLRLSLYPAETLLAAPTSAADSLSAIAVLRGLGSTLEQRAERVRAAKRSLDDAATMLMTQDRSLAALKQQQRLRGARIEAEAMQAAQLARDSAETAAARKAAAAAARADTLRGAVARLDDAEQAAEARFRRQAGAAASLASGAGPGLAVPHDLAFAEAKRPGAPVAGRLVQGWGARTDAGAATGVSYAPPALALVTAPCDGRVDFAGLFRSYGHMLILDCGRGYRFVLAGMDRLDVAIGQKLPRGAVVGRMADWSAGEAARRPSLYVQLRRGTDPVDPTFYLGGHS